MDIKNWILLVGTLLIVAVICHGFWTAWRVRKNEVLMEIESDIPEGDLDDMVALRNELPNGGARVTPTVGFEALLADREMVEHDWVDEWSEQESLNQLGAGSAEPSQEQVPEEVLVDEQIALDDAIAFAEEGFSDSSAADDEGNLDAGYQPEQVLMDLDDQAGLEERYAARAAAALGRSETSDPVASALLESEDDAEIPVSELPPKKLIAPEELAKPRPKQFEPPTAEEIAELEEQRARLKAKAEAEQAAAEAAALAAEKEREQQALVKAEREEARRAAAEQAAIRAREEAEAQAVTQRIASEPVVEFPDHSAAEVSSGSVSSSPSASTQGAKPQELVVLNVIAKSSPFVGKDLLELFLRNGIKFGDMNIFHRIDPVTKANQYSIASLTEPGYFDLRTMEGLEFHGMCLFMQLPCAGQATKVFTDMLTVAEKLAHQLDAEVCDEQYNRLTRQSTEHYRQRVAEFTRRHMSKRA